MHVHNSEHAIGLIDWQVSRKKQVDLSKRKLAAVRDALTPRSSKLSPAVRHAMTSHVSNLWSLYVTQ